MSSCKYVIYIWLEKIESQMRETLAYLLDKSIKDYANISWDGDDMNEEQFTEWIFKYPAQVTYLTIQINWSHNVESSLGREGDT